MSLRPNTKFRKGLIAWFYQPCLKILAPAPLKQFYSYLSEFAGITVNVTYTDGCYGAQFGSAMSPARPIDVGSETSSLTARCRRPTTACLVTLSDIYLFVYSVFIFL